MPHIISIKAVFSKTVQPQQYEPSHASLEAEVAFNDDEQAAVDEAAGQGGDLLIKLREQVYRAVNRQPPIDPQAPPPSAKVSTTTEAVDGAKGGKAKKTTKTPPSGADTADFGETAQTPAPAATGNAAIQAATAEQLAAAATAAANKAAAATGSAPAVNPKLTLDELLKHLNGLVAEKKVKVEDVKTLYPVFKIARVNELKEDQVAAFKVSLDNLEKANTNSSLSDL